VHNTVSRGRHRHRGKLHGLRCIAREDLETHVRVHRGTSMADAAAFAPFLRKPPCASHVGLGMLYPVTCNQFGVFLETWFPKYPRSKRDAHRVHSP